MLVGRISVSAPYPEPPRNSELIPTTGNNSQKHLGIPVNSHWPMDFIAEQTDLGQGHGRIKMHVNYHSNSYVDDLYEIYDSVPKAVFAAILFSAFANEGIPEPDIPGAIIHYWGRLHRIGVIPQRPPTMTFPKSR